MQTSIKLPMDMQINGAAEALMARVVLYYTGYYGKTDLVGLVTKANALNYLQDVITNGGFGLVENYADLWPAAAQYEAILAGKKLTDATYAGETNKEIVFSIKYTYFSDYNGNTEGNHWMIMNGPRKQSIPKYGYGYGWGACTVLPSLYASWDANDKRRDASIMAIAEENCTYTGMDDEKEYTGYYTKKYTPLCDETGEHTTVALGGVNFMIGQYQDYFSIRYADVLLMASELGNELGDANALGYFNQVHTRAGLDEVASIDKNAIFEERKFEFAFEGLRYWDLLRYESSLQYAADKVSFQFRQC